MTGIEKHSGNDKSFGRPQVESFGRPQVESSFTLPFTGVLEDNGLVVWTASAEERLSLMMMFGVVRVLMVHIVAAYVWVVWSEV